LARKRAFEGDWGVERYASSPRPLSIPESQFGWRCMEGTSRKDMEKLIRRMLVVDYKKRPSSPYLQHICSSGDSVRFYWTKSSVLQGASPTASSIQFILSTQIAARTILETRTLILPSWVFLSFLAIISEVDWMSKYAGRMSTRYTGAGPGSLVIRSIFVAVTIAGGTGFIWILG
jgi:hypothetical protein